MIDMTKWPLADEISWIVQPEPLMERHIIDDINGNLNYEFSSLWGRWRLSLWPNIEDGETLTLQIEVDSEPHNEYEYQFETVAQVDSGLSAYASKGEVRAYFNQCWNALRRGAEQNQAKE